MDLKRIIANNIYLLRCQHKLTQEQFAKKLGNNYTRGHISHVELAKNMPSSEFILDVSAAFDVDVNWILQSNPRSYPEVDLTFEDIDLALKIRRLSPESKTLLENLITLLK